MYIAMRAITPMHARTPLQEQPTHKVEIKSYATTISGNVRKVSALHITGTRVFNWLEVKLNAMNSLLHLSALLHPNVRLSS